MAMGSTKRSVMTLYSGSQDIDSHRTRIVLAEKGILVEVIEADRLEDTSSIEELNPYRSLPILVDRDLVLYDSRIIMEYLDERFPHPPLLPVYPVARAKARILIYRFEREWYPLVSTIQSQTGKPVEQARKDLVRGLLEIAPLFEQNLFFLGEEFSLVDCCLAPVLWRLPSLGIPLTAKNIQPLLAYADRIFNRDAFQVSLTETEQEIRDNAIK